jgi:translation initiation factor 1A
MPKKKKAGKNTKSKGLNIEKRKLVEADLNGQVYGMLEKALGSRFFNVNCLDNKVRRCKVRNKRMRCSEGDCVIIALRDFDDENADVIHRFDSDEVRQLKKLGILPDSTIVPSSNANKEEEEVDGFNFEEI